MLLSATAAADKPLKRVVRKLPPRLVAAVAKSSLHTCRELLALGEHELVDRLDLYIPEVRSIVLTVSKAVAKPRTALALLSPPPSSASQYEAAANAANAAAASCSSSSPSSSIVPTGLEALDAHLGGGLPTRTLTELVGPAGVGKTQCCLTMAARALVSGSARSARVLYVDTEGSFSASRLLELIREQLQVQLVYHGSGGGLAREAAASSAAAEAERLLTRVTVMRPESWSQYTACIHEQLEEELLRPPAVALVVVDSIASAVREHFERGGGGGGGLSEIARRQQYVGAQAARLKYYADTHATCVLCVNQVVTGGGNPYGAADVGDVGAVQGRDDGALLAYMGVAWSHYVNVRLVLQYPRFTPQLPPPPPPGVIGATPPRQMVIRVAKAPHAACEDAEFEYLVTASRGLMAA